MHWIDEDILYVICDTFNVFLIQSLSNSNDVETSGNFLFSNVNITFYFMILISTTID